jgi:hypothetical protein
VDIFVCKYDLEKWPCAVALRPRVVFWRRPD